MCRIVAGNAWISAYVQTVVVAFGRRPENSAQRAHQNIKPNDQRLSHFDFITCLHLLA